MPVSAFPLLAGTMQSLKTVRSIHTHALNHSRGEAALNAALRSLQAGLKRAIRGVNDSFRAFGRVVILSHVPLMPGEI